MTGEDRLTEPHEKIIKGKRYYSDGRKVILQIENMLAKVVLFS